MRDMALLLRCIECRDDSDAPAWGVGRRIVLALQSKVNAGAAR